jgi:hypothetical protein
MISTRQRAVPCQPRSRSVQGANEKRVASVAVSRDAPFSGRGKRRYRGDGDRLAKKATFSVRGCFSRPGRAIAAHRAAGDSFCEKVIFSVDGGFRGHGGRRQRCRAAGNVRCFARKDDILSLMALFSSAANKEQRRHRNDSK